LIRGTDASVGLSGVLGTGLIVLGDFRGVFVGEVGVFRDGPGNFEDLFGVE